MQCCVRLHTPMRRVINGLLVSLIAVVTLIGQVALASESGWHVVRVESPDPAPLVGQMTAVAHIPGTTSDWAVGNVFAGEDFKRIWRHDGAGVQPWRPVPIDAPSGGLLFDVIAFSANDAWAFGSFADELGAHILALRWDGATWSQHVLPGTFEEFEFSEATATGSNDVWVVGFGFTDRHEPVVARWNGVAWLLMDFPDVGERTFGVGATAVPGTDDVWIAVLENGVDFSRDVFVRWNGSDWDEPIAMDPSPRRPTSSRAWLPPLPRPSSQPDGRSTASESM